MSTLQLLLILGALFASVSAFSISSFLEGRAEDSCVGRCNQQGTIPGAPCQCNRPCQTFGDCCSDYEQVCLTLSSCAGRCNTRNTSLPCQCNKPCVSYGDCCPDYEDLCEGSTGPGDVTNAELSALSEQLFNMDDNNVARFVRSNIQGQLPSTSCSTSDLAPLPLLTLENGAYTGPTISRMLAMHDNYIPDVGQAEVDTPTDIAERDAFLDAVFATPLMQRTQEFLASKGLPNGRDVFIQIWFDHYTRSSGPLGSSGFEHVFLGELKSGVSGFHNFLFFAREENNRNLNYRGWMDNVSLGNNGSIIEHNFQWRNQCKPISSMFIGTSPELELSLYTVCFYARKSAKCPVTLGGQLIKIQTYDITQNGKTYVASAYPDLSD